MGETVSCCASARRHGEEDRGRVKELPAGRDQLHRARREQFKRATRLHLDAVFGNAASDQEFYRFADRHRRKGSQEVSEELP